MKILITNYHLADKAGSELLTAELAVALKNKGNEVAVFTLRKGTFAFENIENNGIPVYSVDSESTKRLLDFDADVVHVHHWPTFLWLRKIGVKAPAVFGFMGTLHPLETPPPQFAEFPPLWWGVSPTVIEKNGAITGWRNPNAPVIRNWVIPGTREHISKTQSESKPQGRDLIVVSNHFPTEAWEMVNFVAAEMRLKVVHYGLPDNSVEIGPGSFETAHAVITIGRTAYTTAALGVPTLIFDHFGSDGWLRPENYREIASKNLSGRVHQETLSKQTLLDLFRNIPTQDELQQLSKTVLAEHTIEIALGTLGNLYTQAIAQPREPVFANSTNFVTELLEYLPRVDQLDDSVSELIRDKSTLETENIRLSTEYERVSSEYERVSSVETDLLKKVAELYEVIQDMQRSRSWRWTRFLRRD